MKRDYIVILVIILGTVFSILIFVRKKDIRIALLAAVTSQSITWSIGILMVYMGKINYPVRLFPKAADNSFLHGFIMNPSIYAIYYIHYPRHSKLIIRWIYTLVITAIPASIEALENKYTHLVRYKGWNGYYSWIVGIIAYSILRWYLDWFLKNVSKQGVINDED